MRRHWWIEVPLLALAGAGVVALAMHSEDPSRPDLPTGIEPAREYHPPRLQGFRQPPPTEHWLDGDAEAVNKRNRKAWFQERHKKLEADRAAFSDRLRQAWERTKERLG